MKNKLKSISIYLGGGLPGGPPGGGLPGGPPGGAPRGAIPLGGGGRALIYL